MANITQLQFKISSTYDGGAIDRARESISALKRDLEELSGRAIDVRVNVSGMESLDEARTKLDEFGAKHAEARASIDTSGMVALDEATARLDEFGLKRVTAHADVDGQPAHAALSGLDNDFASAQRAGSGFVGSLGSVATAAVALGPALLPIGAAALGAAGGLLTMAAAGGTVAAVFGIAVVAAFGPSAAEAKKLGITVSDSAKSMQADLANTKKAFYEWGNEVSSVVAGPVSTSLNTLSGLFAKLTPLVRAVAPEAQRVADAFKHWTDNNLQGWISWLSSVGVPILHNLDSAVMSLGGVFGAALRAFAPLATSMSQFIANMAAKAQTWATGGGFDRFVALIQEHAPEIKAFFEALWGAIQNVTRTMSAMGGPALGLATALLKIVAAMPPATMQALIQLWLALKSPFAALLVICPPLATALGAILKAIPPSVIQAIVIAIIALRAAWLLWTAAIWLSNTALLTTPVGWIILAIGALIVAIVLLATHWSQSWAAIKKVFDEAVSFLRTGWGTLILLFAGGGFLGIMLVIALHWQQIWAVIKQVGLDVWGWLTRTWDSTVAGLKSAWDAVSHTLSAAWQAVWAGMQTAALAVWHALQLAWNTLVQAIETAWAAASSWLSSTWQAVWGGIQTAALAIWHALQTAWNTLVQAIETAWQAVSSWLSSTWQTIWTGIQAVAQSVWGWLQRTWDTVINGIKSVWDTVSRDVSGTWHTIWTGIQTVASDVWGWITRTWDTVTNGIKSAWDTISRDVSGAWHTFWTGLKTVVQGAVDDVKTAWNLIKAVVGDPINFVIAVWDVVADAIGVGHISEISDPAVKQFHFADGGYVSGPGGPTDDKVPGWLSNREFVMNADATAHWGVDNLYAMNAKQMPEFAMATGGMIQRSPGFRLAGGDTGPGTTAGAVSAPQSAQGNAASVAQYHEQNDGGFGWLTSLADKAIAPLKKIVATVAYDIAKPILDGMVAAIPDPFIPGLATGDQAVGSLPKNTMKGLEGKVLDFIKGKQDAAKKAAAAVGGVIPSGEQKSIIDQALAADGVPAAEWPEWEAGMNTLIGRESAWNAGAINNYDSNAAAGTPSEGLAQVIAPTFAAYRNPSLPDNLLDPVANVAAAINYIIRVYGGIGFVQQANANLPAKGYYLGTDNAMPGWHMVGERGPEWVHFGGGERVLPHGTHPDANGTGDAIHVHVHHNWYGNPSKEAVQYAESGQMDATRRAVKAGVGKRGH